MQDEIIPLRDAAKSAFRGVLTVLTQREITDQLKSWLRSLPLEQRQLILDELTACTLRTLE